MIMRMSRRYQLSFPKSYLFHQLFKMPWSVWSDCSRVWVRLVQFLLYQLCPRWGRITVTSFPYARAGGPWLSYSCSVTSWRVQPTTIVQPDDRPTMCDDELKRLHKFTKMHPPHFSGMPLEDARGFLDLCHMILHNLGLVDSNGVDFTIFQIEGPTKRQWQVYKMGRPVGSHPLTWAQFSKHFWNISY